MKQKCCGSFSHDVCYFIHLYMPECLHRHLKLWWDMSLKYLTTIYFSLALLVSTFIGTIIYVNNNCDLNIIWVKYTSKSIEGIKFSSCFCLAKFIFLCVAWKWLVFFLLLWIEFQFSQVMKCTHWKLRIQTILLFRLDFRISEIQSILLEKCINNFYFLLFLVQCLKD